MVKNMVISLAKEKDEVNIDNIGNRKLLVFESNMEGLVFETLYSTDTLYFMSEEDYQTNLKEFKKIVEVIPYIIKKKDKTGRTGNTGIVQELGIEVIDTTSYEEDLVMLMVNNMDQILAPLFFIMNCDECLRF
jgi:hypothetical protein